ncbi:hypothetical protein [Corallococcus sp. CA041A]|uniref:hypothetical protein n=1 Tax=Corallococcus sp. CA041A TaxID=2316727 RepID=UPI0011C417EB|nr:hypothetical protein [Corallococcus sp. CA041A]
MPTYKPDEFEEFMTNLFTGAWTFGILLLSISLAILAISEISSRHHAIAEIRETENQILDTALNGIQTQKLLNPEDSPELPTIRSQMHLSQVVRLQAARARAELEFLSIRGGATQNSTTKHIVYEYHFYSNMARAELAGLRDPREFTPPVNVEHFPIVELARQIAYTRNDFLLATIIASCTLIGSIIAVMRESQRAYIPPKQLALALASGFVAFLALRGGRSVFMLDLAGEVPNFNPYSMAFSGLLVGLFTKRAYALMALLVDQLEARVHAAVAGPHGTSGQQPAQAQQTSSAPHGQPPSVISPQAMAGSESAAPFEQSKARNSKHGKGA